MIGRKRYKKLFGNSTTGFTLVEVLVAIFVVMIGIGGSYAFLQQNILNSAAVKNELVAAYLAQEGLEIVRNIRDSNFLEISNGTGSDWDEGFKPSDCAAGCEADYTDIGNLSVWANRFLRIDGGLYDTGVSTKYQRRIIVKQDVIILNKRNIEVIVTWKEKGISRNITAATELYNWLVP
jgi:type II secretory pathway pseudopilin PulG